MADEKQAPGPRGALLTGEQAGIVIMRSGEWVRKLSKEGWITRQPDGRFFLLDVVQGYIRFRDDADRRATKSASATRISDARAREIELRTAIREKELMQVDDHISTVDRIAGILRTKLGALAARVTRDLQLRQTIDTVVNEILQEISDAAAEDAHRLEQISRSDQASAENGGAQVGGGEPNASELDRRSGSA